MLINYLNLMETMKNIFHKKINIVDFNFKKHLSFFVLILLLGSIPSKVISQDKDEFIMPGLYGMPDNKEDVKETTQTQPKAENDAVRVDLHRFLGFEILPSRYLSLPYDTFQHRNVKGSFNDVGFVLLLLLPILFVLSNKEKPLTNYLFIALCLLMLIISIPSSLMNQHNHTSPNESLAFLSNNPTQGTIGQLSDGINQLTLKIYSPIHDLFSSFSGNNDSFTYPLLITLFLSILFLLFQRISNYSKITKAFVFFLANYFFFWWILGSGAAWYGMLLFCVPFIFLIKGMMASSEKITFKNFSPMLGKPGILFLTCLIWMIFAFSYRTSAYSPLSKEAGKFIYIPPFIEYQTDNITEDKLQNMLFPNSVEIKKLLNEEKESLIYTVGVPQVKFFVEKNDSRVFSDTFLSFFSQMINKFKDKRKITQALRARGFKYIAFTLNLNEIDQTPDQSLTRKYTNFMNSLYNNPNVELILTDRTIRRSSDNQLIYGVFPTEGTIESTGTLAIFRIK
jgi:hypothetical protein